jgi:hypothetical protein
VNMNDLISKPKFDPSKPFDVVNTQSNNVDTIGKPKFDPSKPFEPVEEPGLFQKAVSSLAQSPQDFYNQGQQTSGQGLLESGLSALPLMGTMAGGVAGAISPMPGGAVIGAGLGGAGGEALKQIGQKYLLGNEAAPLENRISDIAQQGLLGSEQEMGGQLLAKPLQAAGEGLGKYYEAIKDKIKPNAPEITAASERLGFSPTQGMLSENPTLQKMESSLSQSPRPTATEQRQAYENVRKGFGTAAENIEGLKTGESNYKLGSNLKTGLESEVQAAKAPVSELYGDINKDLINIKLQPKINNKSIGILKKDSVFKTKDGKEFLNNISDDINSLENVADLKEYRTNLLKNISSSTSELDRLRYEKVYDQVTNLRDTSIQAIKDTDPFVKASGKSGAEIVDELHNKLALADAAHSENIRQLQKIKGIAGIKGDVKSQGSFLRSLGKVPEEDLIKKAANTDISTLNEFKDKFPALYENAKTAQVNDLVSRSMDKSGLNVTRFLKNVDKLEPEIKSNLFDAKQNQVFEDLKLIQKESPAPSGPSGTPEGLNYKGLLSPHGYASDIAQQQILKNSGILKNASEGLQSPTVKTDLKGLLQIISKKSDQNK